MGVRIRVVDVVEKHMPDDPWIDSYVETSRVPCVGELIRAGGWAGRGPVSCWRVVSVCHMPGDTMAVAILKVEHAPFAFRQANVEAYDEAAAKDRR